MILKPFNGPFWVLLFLIAGAIVLIWHSFQDQDPDHRARFLCGLSCLNILLFFTYKYALSRDSAFLALSGLTRFNWLSELPLQLCNINLFLIPLGILTKKRQILGFAFFIAPLGALMALIFPEAPFRDFSPFLPRMLGFYLTHSLLIVCGLSLSSLGFYSPRAKDEPGILALFLALGLGAHMINTILRRGLCPQANYFFTYGADISALKLLWKLIPVPFLFETPIVLVLLAYMTLVIFLYRKMECLAQRRRALAN